MAQATTIKSGKFLVMLGTGDPIVYSSPCGLTQRSMTLTKGLEEVTIPDCDDPDKVSWLGRDASSLSMSISGEGVLAAESIETWLEAFENIESVPVSVALQFPANTYIWTGRMHIESIENTAPNGQRATMTVSMQSDGEMVRTVTPVTP